MSTLEIFTTYIKKKTKKKTHESTDLSSNFLVNSVTNQNIQNKAVFFLFGRGGGHKIIILLHKYNFL